MNSRIAVVKFSTYSYLIHGLDAGLDGFDNAIDNMRYSGGGTYTAKGLELAYNHILSEGRVGTTKTIVLMTDGYSSNQAAYDAEIRKIKESSISFNLQAIGFGRTMNANIFQLQWSKREHRHRHLAQEHFHHCIQQ